ncbi:MAG: MBOAT family O-acyltransferase [Alphaproteobacteria bacterium]|nr:MBOAT family O-acyltransferase [Alphaproteobacteria bacterium]
MIFNSFEFLFLFFPAAYLGFLLIHRVGGWRAVYPYLAAVSLAFYAHWSLLLVAVLAASVVCNYAVASALIELRETRWLAKIMLLVSVAANVAALGYFKYTNFFIDTVNAVAGTGIDHLDLILPVGISFYTFIQIGFLIEAYNGTAERPTFDRYALFATFFPCVTAGPLVLQGEMFGQMGDRDDRAFSPWRIMVGTTIFCFGLFKKVVFADTIAPYADQVFNGVAAGAGVDALTGWVGALCYTLQLYFDFSGYCDMAVGLGYLFGIKLPLNFNSPLKATSISDFWRRWHITMTRFFTNFLFTPMAMKNTRTAVANGHGPVRRYLAAAAWPITFTFLVAGIWHGAGWTMVVYGLVHGLALAVNLGWREFQMPELPPLASWFLTMCVVVSALVVFRAPDLATAGQILSGMWGVSLLYGGGEAATVVQVDFSWALPLISLLATVVLILPNTQEILRKYWVSSDPKPSDEPTFLRRLLWTASPNWAFVSAVVLVLAVASIKGYSTFLYYQF